MASEKQLEIIRQGVDVWNDWRRENPYLIPYLPGAILNGANLSGANLRCANLSGANLSRANLSEGYLSQANLTGADLSWANLIAANLSLANLSGANLSGANLGQAYLGEADLGGADLTGAILFGANLRGADLNEADLSGAQLRETKLIGASLIGANLSGQNLSGANFGKHNLREAKLTEANLSEANFREADLSKANLSKANLEGADLHGANLSEADLSRANLNRTELIRADFSHATLTGSSIYGISAWDVKLDAATRQENLIITPDGEPVITVDNIKVAQFIYLLLNNQEIRDVIDTITSKAVLILGRFSDERKPVLDALRDELRRPEHNYLPIVFDFQPLTSQTTLETIKTLASMARFVIADLTDARSVLMELGAIVPAFPSVAVRLMIKKSEHEYGMLDYIRKFASVVGNTYEYESPEEVIASVKENVVGPAEAKVKELRSRG
jgi:uncharacterized protein YjbI with pentapeptide repeats